MPPRKSGGLPKPKPKGKAAARPAKPKPATTRKDDVYEAEDSDPDELRHAYRYDVSLGACLGRQ